ncbi:hypothetical protein [Pararhodobacter marinus]|uniref:hypothetical protein n=1 Tax=Pararhodobacter marinus TaxID=2184063 RepID=UPI003518AC6F
MPISSLVDDYITDNRPKLAAHLAHYSRQNVPAYEEAIRRAAYAEWDRVGRKHDHQYRLPKAASPEIHEVLLNARTRLSKATSFLDLYRIIDELFVPVYGAGALMTYDTALRLGEYLGHEPEHVFVQSGVRDGLKAFFERYRPGSDIPQSRYLPRDIFLPELEKLSAKEIENFLCARARDLQGLPRKNFRPSACGGGSSAIQPVQTPRNKGAAPLPAPQRPGLSMLLNPDVFEDHLSHAPVGGVRDAFMTFAHAEYPGGLTTRATSKGFIAHDLRIEKGDTWYFSAVLNQEWVLFYFRKPAFRDKLLDGKALRAAFPLARVTPKQELALRVTDGAMARAVIAQIRAPQDTAR